MRAPAPAALVGLALLAAWAAHAEVPEARPGELPVDVTADQLHYDGRTGDWELLGHVVVNRASGQLRAGHARFFHAAQLLLLDGPVLAVQGAKVMVTDGARVELGVPSAALGRAVLYVKRAADPSLRLLIDPALARTTGKNAATLHAEVAVKEEGATLLSNVTVTPCDCAGPPDYQIESPEVRVEGDRAFLSHPHIRFLGVAVPMLPLALPLEERQSGLLIPQLGYTSTAGLRLAQPIYDVLGRSWDATLTPGLFSGAFGGTHGADLASRTVRGPRLGLELRGAPAEGTQLELGVDLFQDLAAHDSPAQAAGDLFAGEAPSRSGRGFGGLRGTAHLFERSDWAGWTLALQGTLLSDAMVLADTQPAQIDRYLDDTRSDLGISRTSGPLSAGAGATLLQDLRLAAAPDRRLFGAEARATGERLPSPFLRLAPIALGPIALSLEASAVAIAPFASSAQERATGFGPTDLGAGAAVGNASAGANLGRATSLRFDLAPRLSLALPDELPLHARLLLGARADAWLFEGHPERRAQRLQPLAGAEASALLERRFGSVLHTIEPQLFLRAIAPALEGGAAPIGDPSDSGGLLYIPAPLASEQNVAPGTSNVAGSAHPTALGVPALRRALDELDGAAPSTGELEGSLAVRQSLWSRANPHGPPTRLAQLVLRQDVVLWDHAGPVRAADSAAQASLSLNGLSLDGELRWDWRARIFSLAKVGGSLRDERGDDLHTSVTAIRGAAGDRIRAGIDELFAATVLAAQPGDVNGTLSGGAGWALPLASRGGHVGYDLTWHPGSLIAGIPNFVHTLALGWSPPCNCASLALGVDLPLRDGTLYAPTVRFTFALH